jgi:hypothetical protein
LFEEIDTQCSPARRTHWDLRLIFCSWGKHIWEETMNDAVLAITSSCSGLSVALAAVAVNISHRIALMARDSAS